MSLHRLALHQHWNMMSFAQIGTVTALDPDVMAQIGTVSALDPDVIAQVSTAKTQHPDSK